jgi:hypothetical protein
MAEVTAADVARRIDVPPATLRRWIRSGLVPLANGTWSDAAIAQARIVARLRARGHTMSQTLAVDLLPLAAPIMDGLHRRLLRHFVEVTLPDDARVVKTIVDEVMVVGSDTAARVAARAAGGEVVVMEAAGSHLRFDQIGGVTE